jgi:fatty-acyl-CoA synthase
MQSHSLKPVGGKSHVVGDTSRPLLELTIPQLLARAVCANGPREAAVFVDQDKRFTWDEFAETVDQLAAGLLALGPGDRRPRRHLVAQPLGMAGHAVRHRAHRR